MKAMLAGLMLGILIGLGIAVATNDDARAQVHGASEWKSIDSPTAVWQERIHYRWVDGRMIVLYHGQIAVAP